MNSHQLCRTRNDECNHVAWGELNYFPSGLELNSSLLWVSVGFVGKSVIWSIACCSALPGISVTCCSQRKCNEGGGAASHVCANRGMFSWLISVSHLAWFRCIGSSVYPFLQNFLSFWECELGQVKFLVTSDEQFVCYPTLLSCEKVLRKVELRQSQIA